MVVVCDTFDHSDYPVFCDSLREANDFVGNPGEMQRVMEVYNLRHPKQPQLELKRAWRL